jgi:hypothetical protein
MLCQVSFKSLVTVHERGSPTMSRVGCKSSSSELQVRKVWRLRCSKCEARMLIQKQPDLSQKRLAQHGTHSTHGTHGL